SAPEQYHSRPRQRIAQRFGSAVRGRLPLESPSISSPSQPLLRIHALPLRPLSKTGASYSWESLRLESLGEGFREDRAEIRDCLYSCSQSFGGPLDDQSKPSFPQQSA